MAVNGRALTAIGVGSIFIWSGIRGWSVLATLADLITGKKPSQPVINPLSIAGTPAASGAVGVGGIAGIGLSYVGHAYLFGGTPGPNGDKPWDCSSFVNYVVGVKARMAIPGIGPGQYNGASHGPPTGVWAGWNGLSTVKRADVQAGDILIWMGHMGIAISNTDMVNALNEKVGTVVTKIDGGSGTGPLMRIGRLS